MQDINYISLDVSEGWYDVLLNAINFNSEHCPENAPRNKEVLGKVTKYKCSNGTVRVYRSTYECIFYILLENYVMQTTMLTDSLKSRNRMNATLISFMREIVAVLECENEEETDNE